MPVILNFFKTFALANLKPLLLGGAAIAAIWFIYHAGENHVLNQDAAAQLAAGNKALIIERKANEDLNKISNDYQSDLDYFGMQSSTSAGMSAIASATRKDSSGFESERARLSTIITRKVILIHALDEIIQGYQRETGAE